MTALCPSRTGFRHAAAFTWLTAATLLAGCAGKLDHLGKEPSFSPVAQARHAIDPSLPPAPLQRRQSPLYDEIAARRQTLAGGRLPQGGPAGPGSMAIDDARFTKEATGRDGALHTGDLGQASLWASGPTSLFGDRRARTVGDILTVAIDIADSATLNNTTARNRTGTDSVTASTVFGLEQLVDRIIPGDGLGLANGVNTAGSSDSSGTGSVARDETISLRIAATVVDVLPNGHLVVTGNQEVRVNFELRDLQIAGIIRPEDITRQNTITYDKMANARISYGGRGQITDFQQPRIGQQIVDLISPF